MPRSLAQICAVVLALNLPQAASAWQAGGNEPFWSLHLEAGELRLSRLGMAERVFAVTTTELEHGGHRIIRAADPAHAVSTVLIRAPVLCRDSMTGLPHPETVTLSLGDEILSGCGGAPLSLLTDRIWRIEKIGGTALVGSARLSMGFDTAGRLTGAGGCNRWFAGFELTGEGLRIGPVGSTKMACAPALMEQEHRFFEALSKVMGFDLKDDGSLILLGPDGALLSARPEVEGGAP